MSEDPVGFVAGDADLHRYVADAPNNATDPIGYGASAKDDDAKVAAVVDGANLPRQVKASR